MDAHYVPDQKEPLMNDEHGYLTNDDPLDTRNLFDRQTLEYTMILIVAICVAFMLGINRTTLRQPAEDFLERQITAEMLEDRIREIRKENYALEQRKEDLLRELNGE
eukprot:TRINITY_DN1418_c0_g1_i15.p4 TRINITY_DN1418_c0_g1~~TRINITY_DN1418_c0_g1_i15.p4  ORF type:complete len:107 (+),score=22.46 TRINITY_DN1418_c0_g1_i15:324-644(+)